MHSQSLFCCTFSIRQIFCKLGDKSKLNNRVDYLKSFQYHLCKKSQYSFKDKCIISIMEDSSQSEQNLLSWRWCLESVPGEQLLCSHLVQLKVMWHWLQSRNHSCPGHTCQTFSLILPGMHQDLGSPVQHSTVLCNLEFAYYQAGCSCLKPAMHFGLKEFRIPIPLIIDTLGVFSPNALLSNVEFACSIHLMCDSCNPLSHHWGVFHSSKPMFGLGSSSSVFQNWRGLLDERYNDFKL